MPSVAVSCFAPWQRRAHTVGDDDAFGSGDSSVGEVSAGDGADNRMTRTLSLTSGGLSMSSDSSNSSGYVLLKQYHSADSR